MTYSPANTRSIVTAMVGEGGDLLILLSHDTAINAGRVVGPPGEKGDRGQPGVKGDRGADGNTVLTVDGAPQNSDGKEGDWAIDKRALKLYGPKTSAGWGKGNPMTLTDASLDAAVDGARRRSVGDGAWTISRTKSTVDASPLIAATFALYSHPDSYARMSPTID